MQQQPQFTYAWSPAQRGVVAAALTAGVLWYAKPYAFFRPDTQTPRIASWAARPDQRGQATPLPWYAAAALVGLAVDLFT